MLRFIPVLGVCAALALAAGCGDDDDGGSSGGESGGGYSRSPAPSDETQAPAAEGAVAIAMKDIRFDPATVSATVGDTVTWTNEDGVDHNVVGDGFKSDTFGEGGTYEYTLTKAGTVSYECTLHPGMEGTIEVAEKN